MRAGRDPTRRNKKIGTADQGWHDKASGQRPFRVPWPAWEHRVASERWSPVSVEHRRVHDHAVTIVREELHANYKHLCSPEAICGVLGHLPAADVDGLDLVVLRQPSRKQEIFGPTWGAVHWSVDFRGYTGPAVTIDALSWDWLKWERSLHPEDERELARMRAFGFSVIESRRSYHISLTPELVRRWLLVRTVPHEVGHWVDFRRRVVQPLGVRTARDAVDHSGYAALVDHWYRRPHREREEFADRYADEAQQHLLAYLDTSELT